LTPSGWAALKNASPLVAILGFPATLLHGTTPVLDRWLWLARRLPKTRQGQRLLDVGCGSGAFTIGAALRGYQALGLSWDERNQSVARLRAELCGAADASFEVTDVRHLDSRTDLRDRFDVVVCCENIEHILDDTKLMRDMARCLKPKGRLLLTTPFLMHRPTFYDAKISTVEDGGHVRRGYTEATLDELCRASGLIRDSVTFCTGFSSQLISWVQRSGSRVHPLVGWGTALPFRGLPPLLDDALSTALRWPYLSICLEAHKPEIS
jgi:SAM-dependent methyltransferase